MINFGDDKEFIANYEKLKSSRKMGELYGCDKKTITSHAKKIGYDYSGNKEIKITMPSQDLYELYIQLGSTNKVGEQLNCSGTAVRNALIKAGYSLENNQAKLSKISDKDFIIVYNELKSAEKVGNFFGCSGTAILNHAKKIGYDVNSCKSYKLTSQDKLDIIKAYTTSTSSELANKYQVTRGMITKVWYDAGLSGKITSLTPSFIDLSGQKFGHWTVLYKTDLRTANGGIKWHCKCDCGVERDVSALSLRLGTSLSCGSHSNISRGNEKIKQLLQQANIPFETEKKFDTCKDKLPLPFDFYVISNNYLIEYDGIQHYENSIFDYEYTHKHDLIKNQWCKDNNIPLIRIPYTQYKDLSISDLIIETSQFLVDYNAD